MQRHALQHSFNASRLHLDSASVSSRRSRLQSRALAKTVVLPNGFEASYVSKEDAIFLYKEIYEDQGGYLKEGIALGAGDVVVDVGANIGLFSIYCSKLVGKEGRVIAVEPIPTTHAALQQNADRLNAETNGREAGTIEPICAGVSDGAIAKTNFTFYPRAAGWSSMLPDGQDVNQSMLEFLRTSVLKNQQLSQTFVGRVVESVLRILPGPAFNLASRLIVWYMMSGKQSVECKLLTVSDIIAQRRLEVVHLLKIDVERAELAVIRGISESDWPKIRQIAMEVHERTGNLQAVEEMLQMRGFQVSSTEGNLEGTGLRNVFATRRT